MELIGFVGLGTIGGAVARNIQKAGYLLMVHDIRPEAVQPLVDGGSERAGSAAEVARHCRIVFTSLPGPAEVEEVALGADGLLQGVHGDSLYVDLSSSNPNLIRRVATEFRLHGARVMDAPLIVGKNGIANRSVQVLASGPQQAFSEVKPVLDSFGDTVVYTGELGTGTVIKLADNLVRRGIGLAIGEGIVLGAKAGVDPQLLWDCMHWGLEVQLSQLVKTFSETIFKGNYEPPASFTIALSRKDVGLATELGRQHDVPMPIAALVEQIMVLAVSRGWSDQSTASLFRLQEEAAGIEVRKRPK
ncbi:MAG TPA: NAD(P)-binding domain-containing protein [Candidatus Binatia bacterium]|jgi:3-hydroxyisobutyrate dehydrogenase|nr:NAD(P)-binding domain-containing protein [Candidatus Binatia bacterium]